MGDIILHLFAMVRNESMILPMAGTDEQTWITYGRRVNLVVVVMICLWGKKNAFVK